MYEIDRSLWDKCEICNKTLSEIKKDYGGGNIYFSQAFKNHIIEHHNITIEEYFEKHKKISRPICKCGECNKPVKITIQGSLIKWREYSCGRFNGTKEWSIRAKTERCGIGNPMFGKRPWNKDLDISDERIKSISDKHRGKKISDESKQRMSESAKKRLIHGHTGRHHSEKTKNFLRENTLRLIKEGVFVQTKSKPHVALSTILDELNIKYLEEVISGHFAFDFYLVDFNIYIEVDGDYFHSNPKFYPDGPETKTQKINYARDCSKNKYCLSNNIKLYRIWEFNILKSREEVKNQLICILNEYKLSNI